MYDNITIQLILYSNKFQYNIYNKHVYFILHRILRIILLKSAHVCVVDELRLEKAHVYMYMYVCVCVCVCVCMCVCVRTCVYFTAQASQWSYEQS